VRALAGVIGAIGGIPKQSSFGELEEIWNHYRKSEEEKERDKEEGAKKIANWIYPMAVDRKPIIKCVGVWDTVGSYGIPAAGGPVGSAGFAKSGPRTRWRRPEARNGDDLDVWAALVRQSLPGVRRASRGRVVIECCKTATALA
jgi:Uncharacterized alpha/beta hydrolase domain (DUF2235)